MTSKRLYVATAIMAFLSAPLVLLSQIGLTVFLTEFISPALEIIVLMVIAEKIMRPLGRSVLHLRVIEVFIAFRALPYVVAYMFFQGYVPGTGDSLIIAMVYADFTIAVFLFCTYTVLFLYLQRFYDPSLKLLNLHCALRLLGMALFMLGHIAVLFYVAAQIALCIMLLRHARQQDIPMGIIMDVVDESPVDQPQRDKRDNLNIDHVSRQPGKIDTFLTEES